MIHTILVLFVDSWRSFIYFFILWLYKNFCERRCWNFGLRTNEISVEDDFLQCPLYLSCSLYASEFTRRKICFIRKRNIWQLPKKTFKSWKLETLSSGPKITSIFEAARTKLTVKSRKLDIRKISGTWNVVCLRKSSVSSAASKSSNPVKHTDVIYDEF